MPDVFISYRRGDGGWARSLFETLRDEFDVYFDLNRESNDYGDDVPAGIDEALATCRTVLAVIGDKWMAAEALNRLADGNDWVHRELTKALGRKNVRVVPILVGGAVRPEEAMLPPKLQELARKHASVLSTTNWESDCKELASRMKTWISGSAFATAARRAIPAVLPYLCDRIPHEEALVDVVSSARNTSNVLIIVHGHKWESHHGFLERLRHRGVFEDVLAARDTGIVICPLEWNRERAKDGQHAEALKRAIKTGAMQRRSASDADLEEYLGRLAQPLVLVMQVTWSDYAFCGATIVRDFVQAWQGLFGRVDTTSSRQPAALWLNVSYDEPEQELDLGGLSGVLPKLFPVTQGNISDWMSLDEVKRHAVGHETKLLAVTEDDRCCIRKGEVHMLHFADAVTAILSPH